jgi:hypothetical protein
MYAFCLVLKHIINLKIQLDGFDKVNTIRNISKNLDSFIFGSFHHFKSKIDNSVVLCCSEKKEKKREKNKERKKERDQITSLQSRRG